MEKNDVLHSHFMRALLKWFIMVKVIWVIIVASVLQVSAGTNLTYSQTVRLDLRLKNVDLEQVIWAIKKQSEFNFFYSSEEVRKVKDLDVNMKNVTAEEVLNECLAGTNLTYEIVHKAVIIKTLPAVKDKYDPLSIEQQPQKKEVKGKVTDAKGEAIPGASVLVKGTTIGTITDIDGNFTLQVPLDSKTLAFSFIGFTSREVAIGNQTSFRIILEEQTVGVEEVVVVGYGAQKKESVVGAIAQVKGSDLVKAGVPSVANSMVGRVPGMVTIQQTGLPGANDAKIYIRGLSSFTGNNQPLVLVDGIERGLNDIDPSEVESISVLKDASATAVYGVKGGNGVILITTKRGQEGRMEITATYDQTVKQSITEGIQEDSYNTLFARDIMYRNNNDYGKVLGADILEHYRNPANEYEKLIYPNIDAWEKGVKKFGFDSRASVSARGGTRNAKYFISLGYLHEGDLLKSEQTLYDADFKYDRFNFRMNFDFDFTKSTKVSISSNGYVGAMSYGGQDANGDDASIMNNMYSQPPYLSAYKYPSWFVEKYPDPNNPIVSDRIGGHLYSASAQLGWFRHNFKGTDRAVRDRLGADVNISQKLDAITKGLAFKATFSYNNDSNWDGGGYTYLSDSYVFMLTGNTYRWDRYIGSSVNDYGVIAPPYQTQVTRASSSYNYVYSGQFDYARSFGKHSVSGLALVERRISQANASFPHYEEKWSARATYDYDGKYLLEANIGISGSEQFAPENRFGYFPAVAIGWNVAKEPFFRELFPKVNNFKTRYSYGESGNDNTGSQWLYISQYSNYTGYTTGAPGTTAAVTTLREGNVPNMNAQWERAKKHNLGIDLGLFNNSLTLSAELYSENRDGILMSRRAVASWFGQNILPLNIGATKRHGYELEAGYNKTIRGFHYWVKGNFNYNENRVVAQDDPLMTPEYQRREGKPISTTYSNVNVGYYTSLDEIANYSLRQSTLKTIGSDMVLDFNGDATTSNDAVPMGRTNRPSTTYGLSAGLEYKNFDFNFLVQGVDGVDRLWGAQSNPMWINDPGEYYIKVKGRDDIWTPENTDAKYANYGSLGNGWNAASKGITNARYVRLKSAELGYTITGQLLKAIGLSSARLALQGSNLLTWAPGYILGDPENEAQTSNVGFSFYPLPRRYTFALKINF